MRWAIVAAVLVCLASHAWAQMSSAQMERLRAAYRAELARPENPLDLKVMLDAGLTAKKTIGAAGGSLTLSTPKADYVLEIPPDALLYPEEVTLTAVAAVEGLGPETKGILSVQVGPAGLPLAGHGWLTIKPKDPAAFASGLYAFGFSKDGANAHYALRTPVKDGAVEVSVSHFSGFGAGMGAAASSALAQTKPRLAPANANQTAKDAAKISQDQHTITNAANDALTGDTDAKSDANFFDSVKALLGANTGTNEGPGGGGLPTGRGCNVEAEIKFVNDARKVYDKAPSKMKVPRPSLAPSQWDSIKSCAKPPAEKCFKEGDPWPLAKYLQTVRTYKPEASEAAVFSAVVAGLEDNLKRCAKFEVTMKSLSKVGDKNVDWELEYEATFPVTLDLAKTGGVAADLVTVPGKGTIKKTKFVCRVPGATCEATGANVSDDSSIVVSLGDLPSDSNPNPKFDPVFTSPVVNLTGSTSAQGVKFPMDIEIANSSWVCVLGANKSGKGYRFSGWTDGLYPELFKLKLTKSKKCPGLSQPFTIELDGKLLHKPDGAFKPIP
jgi:hypothetical protein